MTFASAFTEFETISWSPLTYRAFEERIQTIQPPDLPCVTLDLADSGVGGLAPFSVDFSVGLATMYLELSLLLAHAQHKPANPFSTLDTFLGKLMDKPTLDGELAEPMQLVFYRSGIITRGANGYFGYAWLMKWSLTVT